MSVAEVSTTNEKLSGILMVGFGLLPSTTVLDMAENVGIVHAITSARSIDDGVLFTNGSPPAMVKASRGLSRVYKEMFRCTGESAELSAR